MRICNTCLDKIKLNDNFCIKCAIPLKDGGAHCFLCKKDNHYHYENIRSAGIYEGVLRELIHKFKYYKRDYIERVLGKLIIDVLNNQPYKDEIDFVMPVPLYWFKKYKRGYNQAELLARHVSLFLKKPLIKDNLIRTRFTLPQFKLGKQKRIDNLKNVFKCLDSQSIRNKTIILIDDICTTGITIEQCAYSLRKAGAKKVYALVAARD